MRRRESGRRGRLGFEGLVEQDWMSNGKGPASGRGRACLCERIGEGKREKEVDS